MNILRRGTLWRRLIFGLVLFGTALALFYAVVNWWAARTWTECQRTLRSRGEVLDFSTLEGPPVPAERNLALLPFFTHWGAYRVDAGTGRAIFLAETKPSYFEHLPHLRTDLVHAFPGVERFDLAAWQRYFEQAGRGADAVDPAQSVLQALEPEQSILDALTSARETMPEGVFRREHGTNDMGYGPVGMLAELKLNFTLLLRAHARSAAGQAPEALHDIETALWLQRATCGKPSTLLPCMLGAALLAEARVPIQNGLVTGAWSSDELARLQAELARIDLLVDYRRAIQGERAWTLEFLDRTWPTSFNAASDPSGQGWWDRSFLFVVAHGPRGWMDENKTALANWYEELLTTCDLDAHRADLAKHRALIERAENLTSPLNFGGYVLREATFFLGGKITVISDAQTQVDELVVRCALARYALAQAGHYPVTLSALVPGYLDHVPAGIMDGRPMHYQAMADGHYQLGNESLEQK